MRVISQIGEDFVIRWMVRPTAPSEPPCSSAARCFYWTGTEWSSDLANAERFKSLRDAALCHPPAGPVTPGP